MANNKDRNYVPGYEAVLLESNLKQDLKKFRFGKAIAPDDMHIERNLVSSAVQLVLSNEDLHKEWLDFTRASIKADIDRMFTS